MLKQQYQMFQS